MSVIPNKNLIILTSALKASVGVVGFEDRCKQTIETLQSLRKHFPNDIILFTDGSPVPIEHEPIMQEVAKYVNAIIGWSGDVDIQQLASTGRKSEAETMMLFKMMVALKQNPELMKMMHEVKRIWKYSSRTTLDDNFNIKDHDHFGKYVFKKRIPSWMPKERRDTITDSLLITRMYSLCPSLLDNYLMTLRNIFEDIIKYQIDTEHSHFKNIDKKHLIELDNIDRKSTRLNSSH